MAKIQPIYYIPPFLAIFGFGGIVCFHKSGAMSRIHRSFYRNQLQMIFEFFNSMFRCY